MSLHKISDSTGTRYYYQGALISKQRYSKLRLIEQGKCTECGQVTDGATLYRCSGCVERTNELRRTRTSFRQENDLCTQCGAPVVGVRYCDGCLKITKKSARKSCN